MLTLLITLLLLGLIILVTTIHQPFIQITGYLFASLFLLLIIIGFNTFHFVTTIATLIFSLVLLLWLLLGLIGLTTQTPQILLKLNFKFKLTLFITTIWFISSVFVMFLELFNLVRLPFYCAWICLIPVYFIVSLLAYYVNTWLLARSNRSSKTSQILLVLGAGLTDGNSPGVELKRRLDKTISINQLDHHISIIVSGGQGPDEQRAEAAAMKDYLIEHHVTEQQIIMEDQSRNTWENLANSQKIINQHLTQQTEITVISNQYHLLRVCLYAKKLNFIVRPNGVRSNRKLYPSASIREWISILLFHPYRHALIAVLYAILIDLLLI